MNTSAAIMLMPTQADSERLAIEGGEAQEQLHVTLAFLGAAEDWTTEQQALVHEAVAQAAQQRTPHTAQAFASALFNPGEGQAHVLLISDGPQDEGSVLESLHIEAMACGSGVCAVMPAQHKPFVAHLTLGYDETVSEEDVLARIGAVQFDRIRVAFADEHTDYLLGEEVPMEPVEAEVEQSVAWSGPIVFEEQMTGDHRLFRAGSIEWDESSLPWPFRWQKASLPAHETAVCVGRVDRLFRAASNSKIIMAEGVVLTGEKAPLEAIEYRNLMENEAAGGVSVDGDSAEFEIVPVEDSDFDVEMHFSRMRLRSLTAVDIPAFIGAKIALVDALALTASAPVKPPRAWFDNPGLVGPTAPSVTSEGQVFGHLALAGTCHISFKDCTTVPMGNSYAYFHTGEIETEDGTCVNVGHLTLRTKKGGHAAMNLSAMAAASHYDDASTVAADVCVGEDEYGVWFAGAARSTLSDEDMREFRAAPLSGDWRKIAGRLELVGVLAVNVPGFPVPRTRVLVASGGTQTMIAGITEEASREARRKKVANAVRRSALRGLVDGVRRQ